MIKEKHSHYALDFKTKIDNVDYTLDSLMRNSYYRNFYLPMLLKVAALKEQDKVYNALDGYTVDQLNDFFNNYYVEQRFKERKYWITESSLRESFQKSINWLSVRGNADNYNSDIQQASVFLTPFFTKIIENLETVKVVNQEFQTWTKKRPGVTRLFKEHYPNEELTLKSLYNHSFDAPFRTALENSRPRSYNIGDVITLRDKYINKYSKDPYIYDAALIEKKRTGCILGFEDKMTARARGSRRLMVFWFASGKKTYVQENWVKIGVKEEEEAQTTG